MDVVKVTGAMVVMASALIYTAGASADSADANCEFYSHGDRKQDRTGPCTFSQRQGNVDIRLSNGKTYSLTAGEKPNHFRDQEDHKVVRESAGGDTQVYKWDQKKIVVSFGATAAAQAPASGDKVAVKDMARYCAGEASAKFKQRPTNISTQPAVQDQGMYTVFGQFPPSGADPTVFTCTFSADGHLVGVDKE